MRKERGGVRKGGVRKGWERRIQTGDISRKEGREVER